MKKILTVLLIAYLPMACTTNTQSPPRVSATQNTIVYDATEDFSVLDAGQVPYYIDTRNDSLGIDARVEEYRHMNARAWREFNGKPGLYDISITVLTEEDGEPLFRLIRNGQVIKTYRASYIGHGSKRDLQPETHTWGRIALKPGDKIGIESMAMTNGEIPEGTGTAWARGRWRQLELSLSASQGPSRFAFDKQSDLLVAQFDAKPNADDLMSAAAFGSLIAHPEFADINYIAVGGAVGQKRGTYINPNSLFELAFGPENKRWVDADKNYVAAIKFVKSRAQQTLAKGRKVWVQEAGPSDFTRDWVKALIDAGTDEALVKSNVIVVQHSAWNERLSTASKLAYVKAKTNYRAVEDGNMPKLKYVPRVLRGPMTPTYVGKESKWLTTATSENNSRNRARRLWQEAQKIITNSSFDKSSAINQGAIRKGGVDFSDMVAIWWILDLNHEANSVHAFWDNYVTDVPLDTVNPPKGRVAIVADGNSPDPDDIGATPVMFAMLKKANLNDRLVHVSHSCDLDPFRNKGRQQIDRVNEKRRQDILHELNGKSIELFGPFNNVRDYYNCRANQGGATRDLVDAINASTAKDPLWIIEAGEPDLIAYALQAAEPAAIQHVHVVSHHPANDDSGDFFTWQQVLDFGVTEHQIGDQNVGLQTSPHYWDWAKNHSNPGIAYIWEMLDYAKRDGIVDFQIGKFDCSDAGMLYWWITGANNGGNKDSTPKDIKDLLPL